MLKSKKKKNEEKDSVEVKVKESNLGDVGQKLSSNRPH